jgi:hypothetical protein
MPTSAAFKEMKNMNMKIQNIFNLKQANNGAAPSGGKKARPKLPK